MTFKVEKLHTVGPCKVAGRLPVGMIWLIFSFSFSFSSNGPKVLILLATGWLVHSDAELFCRLPEGIWILRAQILSCCLDLLREKKNRGKKLISAFCFTLSAQTRTQTDRNKLEATLSATTLIHVTVKVLSPLVLIMNTSFLKGVHKICRTTWIFMLGMKWWIPHWKIVMWPT